METLASTYIQTPLNSRTNLIIKRSVDIFFSLFILLFIFPWIYLVIACCIKIKMPGKVFFKQRRIGLNGRKFICYKFRSMADADSMRQVNDEDRITSLGQRLRISGLDEIPQFWNVFIGDMSIIGPRPHMLSHDKEYSELVEDYSLRHKVKPGITGWAQVNDYRGPVENPEDIRKRIEYDFWYINNWSLKLDIIIMFRTFTMLISKLFSKV